MIEFKRVDQFEKGLIYKLLSESYRSLLDLKPDYRCEFEANWERTDGDLFDASSLSGRAAISTLGRGSRLDLCLGTKSERRSDQLGTTVLCQLTAAKAMGGHKFGWRERNCHAK